ncbi:phospholipase [Pseudomarimonas salicorniae]|uniref:Phospholipase n=1 Tax=Pseudomarimonas salicorniae TaxID=2933270 RepID=A0ABT0GFB3_9GAMM|nr:phospholipase [Lysobacter sp. CAU 1642]MCK7593042.1 phospholipase [Lysobacter sp. CAU 1642]
MSKKRVLAFVHGWSVTHTDTYGGLPEALQQQAAAAGLEIEVKDLWLGRYISFHDEVTLDDLARAMQHAITQDLGAPASFSCITHSTGGPVVRRWVDRYYGPRNLGDCPLRHLLMLAPANHGSALAVIGKSRLGRIKSWFGGVEPGQGVLDWLCLGSDGACDLADRTTRHQARGTRYWPCVLSGETVDNKFYDFLNSYLVEKGSDGVVRLAAANMNYTYFRLDQRGDELIEGHFGKAHALAVRPGLAARPDPSPFFVIPGASHSGEDIGIMRSVKPGNVARKPVVEQLLRCLKVDSPAEYDRLLEEAATFTEETQRAHANSQYGGVLRRFVMLVFRIRDDEGRVISDYDLFLLGKGFEPDTLPKGFFVDKQKNEKSHALVYYLDYEQLRKVDEMGFHIHARPHFGAPGTERPDVFAGYTRAEFRLGREQFERYIRPNETVYVDITLRRTVDAEALRFEPASDGKKSFKRQSPGGEVVDV